MYSARCCAQFSIMDEREEVGGSVGADSEGGASDPFSFDSTYPVESPNSGVEFDTGSEAAPAGADGGGRAPLIFFAAPLPSPRPSPLFAALKSALSRLSLCSALCKASLWRGPVGGSRCCLSSRAQWPSRR